MTATLAHWTAVPLYWLDGRGALTDEQRIVALTEYRRTDGIYLVCMCDPDTCERDDEGQLTMRGESQITHTGPAVDEIDWDGFDAAVAARRIYEGGVSMSPLPTASEILTAALASVAALDRGDARALCATCREARGRIRMARILSPSFGCCTQSVLTGHCKHRRHC
jgi:hypothetical protein